MRSWGGSFPPGGGRQQALEDLARECVEKFKVFGITPAQAAEIMLHVKEEEK